MNTTSNLQVSIDTDQSLQENYEALALEVLRLALEDDVKLKLTVSLGHLPLARNIEVSIPGRKGQIICSQKMRKSGGMF